MMSPCIAFSFANSPQVLMIAALALVLIGSKQMPFLGQRLADFWRTLEEFERILRAAWFPNHRPAPKTPFTWCCDVVFAVAVSILLASFAQHVHR